MPSLSSAAVPSRSSTRARDARLELLRGPLGERERDDPRRVGAVRHQVREPLRDNFGLARTSACDDLQVRAAVQYGRSRVTFELWCGRAGQS